MTIPGTASSPRPSLRATARPVCQAFLDAMSIYGVPEEVLTDNGTRVYRAVHQARVRLEVLFERICRENGITQRLTKPASPTTTGKIERLHQSLQIELLNDHGPFESIEALQAALDAWRQEYNTDRPHQSLGMAFPASRFSPADCRWTCVYRPSCGPDHGAGARPDQAAAPAALRQQRRAGPGAGDAGWPWRLTGWCRRRGTCGSAASRSGSARRWPAGTITIWVDEISLHVLLEGTRLKTLPSRLGVAELARLAADGARPAGPSPLPTGDRTAIEVERMVNATGLVGLAGASSVSASSWPGSGSPCAWTAPRWPSSATTGAAAHPALPVPPPSRYRLRGARRTIPAA